ncbi:unnamed protein product [Rotaria magnacalcarata]|uniref:Ammonium transporter n=4 Tax=Rotaria magnacalcarata TaxID=392030 RepID=A0A816LFK1_9BILA|nr:unnamed protein product [Rotaria magnacalcarata]CAF1592820.1 unnamed protein product [Rotaria magnacalcarata]CAF1934317.1 unnamed protein product [Rotaria magnacalcarata]CAF1936652.1 unnamed protein product [Rotaria magnacalcarata]CAF2119778.1 unnamed protein product [Rotaria magnacalcarata]
MNQSITNPSCINTGDTTWVLVSSISVLSMMPALAFFEAGLLKITNTVSLVTQIIGGASILSVMWHLFGFTLVFGRTWAGVIGNFDYIFMLGVPYDDCAKQAPHIPAALYAFFQMMFASITPLLMTGAFVERLKFKAFIILIITWEILIYYPVAHWIWGDGWLKTIFEVQDFAGGLVVHTTSGVSAVVCAIVLGHRRNFDLYNGEFPPSNLPLAALGGALLWTAWFGFNGGSALTSGSLAVSTVVATQRAAVCSGIVWLTISWIRNKPSAIAVLNGVIAGLAGITPASGFIDPQYAALLGVILGVASYLSVILFKRILRIDDALDVSSVHGVTGIIGSIAIGFFGQKAFNKNGADGLFFGNNSARQLGVQILAVIITALWSALVTFLLLNIIDRIVGLKVEPEEGLDFDEQEHGEKAYIWRHVSDADALTKDEIQAIIHGSIKDYIRSQEGLGSLNSSNDIPLQHRSYSTINEK